LYFRQQESREKSRNEELHDLYSSPDTYRIIKSRTIGWTGYVECIKEETNAYGVLVVNLEGQRPRGRRGYRWKANIKMALKDKDGMAWTRFIELRQIKATGFCEHGTEPLFLIKLRGIS